MTSNTRFESREEIVISVRLHVIIGIISAVTLLNFGILALTIWTVKSNLETVWETRTLSLENKM